MNIHLQSTPSNYLKNTNLFEEVGLSAILIFNDSGLPIYIRNYSNESKIIPNASNDDDLILSAFLSSLSHFIKVYDNDEFRGFSTQNYRYYIKSFNEKIYCLVLNFNAFKLSSGPSLISILDNALDELIKSFSVYYKMTKTKDFIEKSFLDSFEKQIDTQLLFNFKNTKSDNLLSKHNYKDPYYEYSKEFLSETFNHIFLKHGILGVLIFDHEYNLIVIRDYVINQKYLKKNEYYQRISLIIAEYNRHNIESIMDIGTGTTRIISKITETHSFCLILSEIYFWKLNERKIRIFTNELLKNIPKILPLHDKSTSDGKNNANLSEVNLPINYAVDKQLHNNLREANKHLE